MTILNGIFKTYDLSDSFFDHCINELGGGVHLVPVTLSVVRRTTRDNIVDIRFCYNHRDPLPFPRSMYRALVKNFPTSYSACFLNIRIYPNGGIRINNIIFEDATYEQKPREYNPPYEQKPREYNPQINKKSMMKDYLLELKIKLKEERNKIDTDGSLSWKQKHDKQKELTQHYTNLRKQKNAEVKSIKVINKEMNRTQKRVINKEITKKLRAELYAERDKIENNVSLNSYQKRELQYKLTRTYRDKIEEAKIK